MRGARALCLCAALACAVGAARAQAEPPVVPVGLDAYRRWDRWPYQRIGVRAYMRSTCDRTGGNDTADASRFLYQLDKERSVTLDVEAPGILYFARFNRWHGSPWHFEVDGRDHVVQETNTADPLHPVAGTFLPAKLFPPPLALTFWQTMGSDLCWVPIAFEKSFRLAYSRTFYGTGYYIHHQFGGGAPLSRPLAKWDGATPPAQDVLDLLGRAGEELLPRTGLRGQSGRIDVPARGAVDVFASRRGPAMLRLLRLSVPRGDALALGRLRLRMTWDDRAAPSVDAPVALFFGAGTLWNRDGREFLVRALPVVVRFLPDKVDLQCVFPMPFFRSARIELVGAGDRAVRGVEWEVRHEPYRDPPNHVGWFHATYCDHAAPRKGHDLVLLDTARVEGGGAWSGHLVGTSLIFSHDAVFETLEGDPRFFFDDSRTPQAQGTGTEEWCGGGDYWGGLQVTLPLVGHPVGAPNAQAARGAEDRIESAYRFLLADLMPFGRNALIRLEHGGQNRSTEHYETVTYWYGLPAASLIPTDELVVADAASAAAHDYAAPDASAPYELSSRYEWGPDVVDGVEIQPRTTAMARTVTTTSEFTLAIDPANRGVLLRRTLDYSLPDQRAEVYVAAAGAGARDWQPAGIWYLAGSTTCVFSCPRQPVELGAAEHIVQTSDRRFRDDEFLVPYALTKGRSAIRVRIVFTPVARPLFPGHAVPKLGWSEIRYTAWSWVMPRFP